MTDPKIKLPEQTATASGEKFTPVVTGKTDKTVTMQNKSNLGRSGKETSFRADLPPVDQMFDANNSLKPEIASEADKTSEFTNEPANIGRQEYSNTLTEDWKNMDARNAPEPSIEHHDIGTSDYFPHKAFGIGSGTTPWENEQGIPKEMKSY